MRTASEKSNGLRQRIVHAVPLDVANINRLPVLNVSGVLAHIDVRRVSPVEIRVTLENLDTVKAVIVSQLDRRDEFVNLVKARGDVWAASGGRAL